MRPVAVFDPATLLAIVVAALPARAIVPVIPSGAAVRRAVSVRACMRASRIVVAPALRIGAGAQAEGGNGKAGSKQTCKFHGHVLLGNRCRGNGLRARHVPLPERNCL